MMYLLALFLPGIAVILKGRIGLGLLLCLLHLTIIGWIPASIVAIAIINDTNRRHDMKAAIGGTTDRQTRSIQREVQRRMKQ